MPERRADEDRNEFISRCISKLTDENPEMSDEQKQAICIEKADMSIFASWDEIRNKMGVRTDGRTPDRRFKNNK